MMANKLSKVFFIYFLDFDFRCWHSRCNMKIITIREVGNGFIIDSQESENGATITSLEQFVATTPAEAGRVVRDQLTFKEPDGAVQFQTATEVLP